MKINKPKFWDKKIGLISILLIPLSIITQILIFIKKILQIQESLKFLSFALEIYMLEVQEKHLLQFF